MWSGLSLGVTPAMTALLAPSWGRLSDRFGRKIMVERSLVSFICLMAGMAFVTRPWHVFALRAVQGLFAGYGAHRADHGRGIGAARSHGLRDRHGADRAAARPGARPDHRRRGRADGRSAPRLPGDLGLLRGGAGARVLDVRRAARATTTTGPAIKTAGALPERAGVRELRPADGGRLRAAVRRSQLRADPAAVCRRARHAGRAGAARRRDSSSRSPRRPARSAISCARRLLRRAGRHGRSSAGAAALGAARRAGLPAGAAAPLWLFAATPLLGVALGHRDDDDLHRRQRRSCPPRRAAPGSAC